ncbi:MAG: S24/S26 family peptidase [Pseudomonadota bacterium]
MTFPAEMRRSPEHVRGFLKQLCGESGVDYATLSRLLDKNASYIHQFIYRGTPRRLHEEDRKRLADYFGISQFELGGPPNKITSDVPADVDDDRYLYVPAYNISASAGPGLVVDQEYKRGELAFRRDWIKSVSNAPVDQLAVVRVEGDSMYPTLTHGDHVLIDRQQTDIARDGIYVLRVDDSLQIKRILVHPGTRQIKIKSDNPLFDHWNDCAPESLSILGRAVWVGRRL